MYSSKEILKLHPLPISIKEANEFILNFHRHNAPVKNCRFAIGAGFEGKLVGVAIIGNPVARLMNDGFTMEVLRVCAKEDSPKNTCSFLYGRSWRVWQQMGGLRMITYTLQSESGSSLKGSGWKIVGETKPSKGWSRKNRDRKWQPIYGQMKFRWEVESY